MHDPNLHLFVDTTEIHQLVNLERFVNSPRFDRVVLQADEPWELGYGAAAWGSVVKESDGRLRMWYMLFDARCYCVAESDDGLTWHKPNLGLVEFRGSKDNNIFCKLDPDAPHGELNNWDGYCVLRDDGDPDPQKRYKLFANMQDHHMWAFAYRERYPDTTQELEDAAREMWGDYMMTSPDGIHWSEPQMIYPRPAGDYMMVIRDERNKQWFMNRRVKEYSDDTLGVRSRRNIGIATSPDLLDWSRAEIVILNDQDTGFGRLWEWHGMTPFNYGNLDLGFLEMQDSVFRGGVELACHRDGGQWQRVLPGVKFLGQGPEGSPYRLCSYPLHNPPIPMGDELFIYSQVAGGPRDDGISPRVVGLYRIGLDRFLGLSHSHPKTHEPTGLLVTTPQFVPSDELEVNVEAYNDGQIRVAVADSELNIIPGFSFDDCVPVRENAVRSPVCWRERPNLAELRGKEVMLLFNVDQATLYSYRFA